MKQLILTLVLVTLSAPVCFGEWTGVTEGEDGNTYYVDFERIKERRGYVYYWYLTDYPKPNKDGNMSMQWYLQGDCDPLRFKTINSIGYKEPMGEGFLGSKTESAKNWIYPPPDSVYEGILKRVCRYVKLSEKSRKDFLEFWKEFWKGESGIRP